MEPTPHGSGSDEHGATARPAGRQREKTLAEQFADAEGLGDDDLPLNVNVRQLSHGQSTALDVPKELADSWSIRP